MSEPDAPDPEAEIPRINGLAAAILGTSELTVFENLYLAYAGEARAIAVAILGDRELAADAVHSGFLEMLRYLVGGRRWRDPADARAMVLRNVRWAALKAHRGRGRMRFGFDGPGVESADDATWARAEARALCDEIVSQLNPRYQDALRLRFVEGLSNIDAARHLGVSIELFESRIRRAIKAARNAARSTGLLPQLAAFADAVRRVPRWRGRFRWPDPVPAVKSLCIFTAGSVAAAGITNWTAARPFAAGPVAVAPRLVAAAAPAAVHDDAIDTSLILDAIALPSAVVVALGEGRSCGCLEVFRSTDGGATWDSAPGPAENAQKPRLALAAGYPTDQRIIVDPGGGRPTEVSPRFGLPFAAPPGRLAVESRARHAQPCSVPAANLYCRGQEIAGLTAGEVSGPGAVLWVARGRLIYFRRLGGMACSADGGVSWGDRCPPS